MIIYVHVYIICIIYTYIIYVYYNVSKQTPGEVLLLRSNGVMASSGNPVVIWDIPSYHPFTYELPSFTQEEFLLVKSVTLVITWLFGLNLR